MRKMIFAAGAICILSLATAEVTVKGSFTDNMVLRYCNFFIVDS